MLANEPDFLHYLKTSGMTLTGKYDIPTVKGIKLKHLENADLIGFNYATNPKNAEFNDDRFVHFFLSDNQIERLWDNLEYYEPVFRLWKGIIQPDFSQYTTMPRAMCIWQHYRRMWVTQYYQNRGLHVIPAPCWSDEESFEYCFDGMPKGSCLCVSSVGCMMNAQVRALFNQGLQETLNRLEPSQLIIYGKIDNDLKNHISGIPYKHIVHEMKERIQFSRLKERKNLKWVDVDRVEEPRVAELVEELNPTVVDFKAQ